MSVLYQNVFSIPGLVKRKKLETCEKRVQLNQKEALSTSDMYFTSQENTEM